MYRLTHWYLITGFPPTYQGASSLTTFVWNSTLLRSDSLCSIEIMCVAIVNKFIVSRILLSRLRRLDAVLPSLKLQVFKKFRRFSIIYGGGRPADGVCTMISSTGPPTSGFIEIIHIKN